MVNDVADRADGLLENVSKVYSSEDIKKICTEEGVDDAGFVEVDRKEFGRVREEVLRLYPKTNFNLQTFESRKYSRHIAFLGE